MKTIVITGASRGIGYGLAAEFLKRGHRVAISGRKMETAERARRNLAEDIDSGEACAAACDVRSFEQVVQLWETTASRWGQVDIWINNAGVAHRMQPAWELDVETAAAVIHTNILGTYHGCKTAIPRMISQGSGAIYNMEGYGSRGSIRMGLSLYGTSKAAGSFLSKSLIKELKDTPVILGTLQPGMVATEMVTGQYEDRPEEWERIQKVLNIFIEPVEAIAPKLADRILANRKHGAVLSVSSRAKVMLRFAMSPFTKREVLE